MSLRISYNSYNKLRQKCAGYNYVTKERLHIYEETMFCQNFLLYSKKYIPERENVLEKSVEQIKIC
jgi:hypothetical protein